MNALLAIKPEFADKILDGEKRYEFRKSIFRDSDSVETVYMYASSPVKQVVGAFTMETVRENKPAELWEKYGDRSGISERERFMSYFGDSDVGYAIEIGDTYRLSESIDPRSHVEEFVPPVSFYYPDEELESLLRRQMPPRGSQGQHAQVTQYSSD